MALALGLGLDLATRREGVGGGQGLMDLDFVAGRYWFNGQFYADEAAINVAAGGVKSGETRTYGPYVFGAELLTDPGFSSGLDGFTDAPSYDAAGDVSLVGGAARMQLTAASGTQYRARRSVAVEADRGYVYGARFVSRVTTTSFSLSASSNTDLGGGNSVNGNINGLPQTLSIGFAAPFTPCYFGVIMQGTLVNTTRLDVDDTTLKRADPLPGFTPGSFGLSLAFTTPATVASAQVVWQTGDDGERQRVRFVLGTDYHLTMVITKNSTQLDSVDLGTLSASTAYVLDANLAPNRVVARVGLNPSKVSIATAVPGSTKLWLGRSFTGETFTGTIQRFTLYPYEVAPTDTLVVEGDSYAGGAGGVSLPITAKADGRAALTTGVGGTTLADQLVRMQAKPNLFRSGVLVIWDGSPNGNGDVNAAMAIYEQMAAFNPRFVFIPPLRFAAALQANNDLAAAIRTALITRWPSNVVDAQAILAAHATSPGDDSYVAAGQVPDSLLQADDGHLTSTAMGYVWSEGVKPLLTSRGW